MDTITLTFENGEKKEYMKGIKLKEVIETIKDDYTHDIIAGVLKNHIISYEDAITKSGTLFLKDINSKIGNQIYELGLIYLFESSILDILGKDTTINIKHSLDKGIYCEISKPVDDDILTIIKDDMKDKVSKAIPFVKIETSRLEAIEYFKKIGRMDKAKTLFYNTSDYIPLYKFNGLYNYVIGTLPQDTSFLKYFDLTKIEDSSIVLRFPGVRDNSKVLKYTPHPKYLESIQEYSEWGRILNINNVGDLNEYVSTNDPAELINLSEIMQDYKLLSIAENITLNKDEIKFILISGPSSSGKTTTSRKLGMYLKTLGINPIPISLDDYFVNRIDNPLDEYGKPDYETINAIDVKLFQTHINKLLNGEKVLTPIYDFVEGKKIFKKEVQIRENDVLIIEGLHALNDTLTKDIPKKNKYKIYISPLTFLNIDNDNRIKMTDIRLLRRMIRDNRTRGYSPSQTLDNWHSVRRGEDNGVFAYQDEADVVFNSSLAYELGVLRTYAMPLLFSVKEDDKEYLTALRLIEFLMTVLPIPSDYVPKVSLLREFIGGSYFEK